MPTTAPFETLTGRYDEWFETHEAAYSSELAALRRLVPTDGPSVEIGVGTARFAEPLGVDMGIDPAGAMLERARERGVDAIRGVAEQLPLRDDSVDTALLVTTICFVDSIPQTLAETDRVLRADGSLVLGYVDRESPVGEVYRENQAENPFYRDAQFTSTRELLDELETAGFTEFEFVQTIYRWPGEMETADPVEEGYGDGSFVGLRATR